MKKFLFNSIIRKPPRKSAFIRVIWKSRHRHLGISIVIAIGIMASALQKFIFSLRIFLERIGYLYSFMCLVNGISTTLLQILIFLRFPIHSSKGGHWCSRKRLFEFSEACFEKLTSPKIPAYFPVTHSGWSPF